MSSVDYPVAPQKPKLLDRVREGIRARHYSCRTEDAYIGWIKRYIFSHGKRHPSEMGAGEITQFLSSLALEGRVAASTQNQALSALRFLYREVLQQDLPWLDGIVRAKRPIHLPVVLTRAEVEAVLAHLRGTPRLMGTLLYGAGLRLLPACRARGAGRECAQLRVKDVDYGYDIRTVQELLGHKDVSTTMIDPHVLNRGPAVVRSPADRLAILPTPAPPPPAGNRPAEIGCKALQPNQARSTAPRGRVGPLPVRGYPQNPLPGAAK
jgi:integrase